MEFLTLTDAWKRVLPSYFFGLTFSNFFKIFQIIIIFCVVVLFCFFLAVFDYFAKTKILWYFTKAFHHLRWTNWLNNYEWSQCHLFSTQKYFGAKCVVFCRRLRWHQFLTQKTRSTYIVNIRIREETNPWKAWDPKSCDTVPLKYRRVSDPQVPFSCWGKGKE